MARVAKVKAEKTVRLRTPLFADEKYTGPEPVWDHDRAVDFSDEEFDHHLRKSLSYYNYFYSPKELKKFVIQWLETHSKLTKKQIATYKQSSDQLTPITLCGIVKASLQGMPLRERHREYILATVDKIIKETTYVEPTEKKAEEKKVEYYRPTIQDRLNEKVSAVIGEIEGELDLIAANQPATLKIFDYLTTNKVAQASVGKISAVIDNHIAEFLQVEEGKDVQLKEGYSNFTKKDIKRILAWLQQCKEDLTSYTQVKKQQKKVRKVKAPSKDKLVSKVKYQVEDKTLKIVSIPPSTIIGAAALWVYNTKTRKLGVYHADPLIGTLSIKGTSIIGYDESKSVAKTLRKPETQLKDFFKATKPQLKKFLSNIKAVEVKLNGRISADTLLLKVE